MYVCIYIYIVIYNTEDLDDARGVIFAPTALVPRTCICTCIYIYIYIYFMDLPNICVYMCVYIYIYIYTHTYTCDTQARENGAHSWQALKKLGTDAFKAGTLNSACRDI